VSKRGEYTLHANRGSVLDCTVAVNVECDSETIAFRFPQLERESDNISPMVYACVNGTVLHVILCGREDIELDFVWNERTSKWVEVTP
jgi:hypothetical protein